MHQLQHEKDSRRLTQSHVSCVPPQQNVAGDTLVFDVNSNSPTKVVYSAADCCKQCQQTSGCNTWTFCGHTEGCSSDCPANVQMCASAASYGHSY